MHTEGERACAMRPFAHVQFWMMQQFLAWVSQPIDRFNWAQSLFSDIGIALDDDNNEDNDIQNQYLPKMNSQQFSHLSERSGIISKSSIFCRCVIDPGSGDIGIGGGD